MTRDETIRMAREAGWDVEWGGTTIEQVSTFAALVAAEEREACLDWCAAFAADDGTAQKIAEAIRARGGDA